jgi:hypothetical protein
VEAIAIRIKGRARLHSAARQMLRLHFREAGMYPLQYTCLHRVLTFLESALDLDDGEYVKVAMLDCIADARIAGVDNWFSKLSGLLAHVNGGVVPADALHPDRGP